MNGRFMTKISAPPSAVELREKIRDVVDRANHWRTDAADSAGGSEGLTEFLLVEVCRFVAESAIQTAHTNELLEEIRGSVSSGVSV